MSDVQVTFEPRVYGINSPNSFYRDLVDSHRGDTSAASRLDRYAIELQYEIESGSSEGLRNLDARRAFFRQERPHASRQEIDREARAATSATMAGFTTPQYLLDEFATYRGTQRTFIDQTTKFPLPDVGLTVNVPAFTSGASAGVQTEGGAVAESDPTGAYLSPQSITTIAGQVTVSQQLLDQGGAGAGFDAFVYLQLRQQYDQTVNIYALGQALSAGTPVAQAGAFSIANLYQDLAACRETLYDTAGTRLAATHVFTTADLYGYVTRQLDTQNRPLIVPQFAPGNPLWPDSSQQAWQQFTGTVLPGTVMWFVDDSIQPSGGNTFLIVSRPDTIITMEGAEPLHRVVLAPTATSLNAVVQLYNYVVVVPRYPSATAYVNGSAYPTTLV